MKHHIPLLFLSFFLFFLLTSLPQSYSQELNKYLDCSLTSFPFSCGRLKSLHYPFWADVEVDEHYVRPRFCGGRDEFKLYNCSQTDLFPYIKINSQEFQVLDINLIDYTIKMNRTGLASCDPFFTNNSLSLPLFQYTQNVYNFTLFYDCPVDVYQRHNFTCPKYDNAFYMEDTKLDHYPKYHDCEHRVQLQVLRSVKRSVGLEEGLREIFKGGFEVNYDVEEDCKRCIHSKGLCGRNDSSEYQFSCLCQDGTEAPLQCPTPDCQYCEKSGGRCGFDGDQFLCFCKDKSYLKSCGHGNPLNLGRNIGIGVSAAVFGALVVIIAIYFYRRRKKNNHAMSYVQSQSVTTPDPSLVKDPEKGSQYFGVHVFTYQELEEATNNFDSARELGDGGFGTVYYGQLHDGRCVAVKRLYENNYRRVEQFMNEVEILTRLHHPNLVSLFGCTSRHSRELLLVYEYISNGTVADHLHGGKTKLDALPWHIRMNIAVDTASALKYLHASDIIHRDVKTNNILLDDHFCVKVADFGLSRLFPMHVTHISTAPQGTPGYVDPEYHECYQLTDKSDVYSFGVVLIELISSLPAVDITRHRHEINLSNMAINKIQHQALHELVDPILGFESDFKVRKMINAVAELAFRCLQSSKDMRPSMDEVVENLLDIQSDGKDKKSQPEVLDISADDDIVLLKDDPPPPSPDSNVASKSTTPNASG